jgi:hypothetical protein
MTTLAKLLVSAMIALTLMAIPAFAYSVGLTSNAGGANAVTVAVLSGWAAGEAILVLLLVAYCPPPKNRRG